MSTWTRDPTVAVYVEARLKRGIYRAIGESHFGAGDVGAPVVRRIAELALRTDVAPDGTLGPEWRTVFMRHPDRFVVGTDTWVTSR